MAPTICSGKKRQTRTISNSNIRRHEQGPHHLNQALSNIANFVSNGYINSRVSASLRTQAGLNNNHLTQTSATPTSNHRRQQFSFVSDNAVTSSAHSDTENSFDLRLANEILINDSTTTTYSSNTSITTLSPSSLSTRKEKTSPPTSQCQERIFKRYSTVMQANSAVDHEEGSEKSESDSYANNNNSNKATNGIYFSNLRKHYLSSNDYDSDDSVSVKVKDRNSDMSENGNDADMDTDESDSMTSLDTEKSAKLKFENNPLIKDKVLAKKQTNNNSDNDNSNKNNNPKSFTNIRNTDGLLSIAIKTIKLVKRNQLLQQRLTQLQMETSEFIQSVLANPENRHFRENVKQKVQQVENV